MKFKKTFEGINSKKTKKIGTIIMKKNIGLGIALLFMTFAAFTGCGGKNPPPASITFRRPIGVGDWTVMQITNRSGSETLMMHIDEMNGEQDGFTFKVLPGETHEVGGFTKGKRYTLSADGYSGTITGKVP